MAVLLITTPDADVIQTIADLLEDRRITAHADDAVAADLEAVREALRRRRSRLPAPRSCGARARQPGRPMGRELDDLTSARLWSALRSLTTAAGRPGSSERAYV
jgi:hypothetical protein